MAWDHLSLTQPHLVYIILGGFTTLFMLCSSIIKERMYIGEATVATLCGIIFGPHAANLIDPSRWGNEDIVTIEFSRIVLVVQCFAIGVELPKFYMEKHWRSVFLLLVPVMTFGWLITSLFVWWMVIPLSWLDSLVVAACVTATDPVLASSVVGKGKFAKKVPKHLRDLLSAESGCNDGMAFPFVYLSLYLIQEKLKAGPVTFHWIVVTILYECVFGAFFGFVVGYLGRHGIKYAEKKDWIDRESFLVFYFVLALFCAGSGSILGIDDLLVGFACGVGFSNDGWFTQKTEESHVSNVIDLLLNLTYFVYFGTIIPWGMFNNAELGLSAWRLTVLAIFVILFRRIPIMLALKPVIPDMHTWREALFAGHFGPIGVGAIYVAILARAELEWEHPVPLSQLPDLGGEHSEHLTLLTLVWPIVAFLVVASIIVHGSSIAVFTLGKHINTLTITMSYTQAQEDGPSWVNRLPRVSSRSRSQAKATSDTEGDDLNLPQIPPGTLPPGGLPAQFLRRVKGDDSSNKESRSQSANRKRRSNRKWDDGIGPGGPISQSAIFPQRRSAGDQAQEMTSEGAAQTPGREQSMELSPIASSSEASSSRPVPARHGSSAESEQRGDLEIYDEGDNIVFENRDGDVIAVNKVEHHGNEASTKGGESAPKGWGYGAMKKRIGHWRDEELEKRREQEKDPRKRKEGQAYLFGNTIIVENDDGDVVKAFQMPSDKPDSDLVSQSLKKMGMGGLIKPGDKGETVAGPSSERPAPAARARKSSFAFVRPGTGERKKSVAEEKQEEDDRQIRFTIGGVGKRMTKDDFIKTVQKLPKNARREVVEQSSASQRVKTLAKQDPPPPKQPQQQQQQGGEFSAESSTAASPGAGVFKQNWQGDGAEAGTSSTERPSSSRSVSPGAGGTSRGTPETAAERKRRLAVLSSVMGDDDDEEGETAAERRRREAALGVSATESGQVSDSDDDDTPRVPPPKRGIRFAEPERARGERE